MEQILNNSFTNVPVCIIEALKELFLMHKSLQDQVSVNISETRERFGACSYEVKGIRWDVQQHADNLNAFYSNSANLNETNRQHFKSEILLIDRKVDAHYAEFQSMGDSPQSIDKLKEQVGSVSRAVRSLENQLASNNQSKDEFKNQFNSCIADSSVLSSLKSSLNLATFDSMNSALTSDLSAFKQLIHSQMKQIHNSIDVEIPASIVSASNVLRKQLESRILQEQEVAEMSVGRQIAEQEKRVDSLNELIAKNSSAMKKVNEEMVLRVKQEKERQEEEISAKKMKKQLKSRLQEEESRVKEEAVSKRIIENLKKEIDGSVEKSNAITAANIIRFEKELLSLKSTISEVKSTASKAKNGVTTQQQATQQEIAEKQLEMERIVNSISNLNARVEVVQEDLKHAINSIDALRTENLKQGESIVRFMSNSNAESATVSSSGVGGRISFDQKLDTSQHKQQQKQLGIQPENQIESDETQSIIDEQLVRRITTSGNSNSNNNNNNPATINTQLQQKQEKEQWSGSKSALSSPRPLTGPSFIKERNNGTATTNNPAKFASKVHRRRIANSSLGGNEQTYEENCPQIQTQQYYMVPAPSGTSNPGERESAAAVGTFEYNPEAAAAMMIMMMSGGGGGATGTGGQASPVQLKQNLSGAEQPGIRLSKQRGNRTMVSNPEYGAMVLSPQQAAQQSKQSQTKNNSPVSHAVNAISSQSATTGTGTAAVPVMMMMTMPMLMQNNGIGNNPTKQAMFAKKVNGFHSANVSLEELCVPTIPTTSAQQQQQQQQSQQAPSIFMPHQQQLQPPVLENLNQTMQSLLSIQSYATPQNGMVITNNNNVLNNFLSGSNPKFGGGSINRVTLHNNNNTGQLQNQQQQLPNLANQGAAVAAGSTASSAFDSPIRQYSKFPQLASPMLQQQSSRSRTPHENVRLGTPLSGLRK